MVDVMQDKGISTPKMEAYIQRLRRGDGASCAEVVYPMLLDFWKVQEKEALWKKETLGVALDTDAFGYCEELNKN